MWQWDFVKKKNAVPFVLDKDNGFIVKLLCLNGHQLRWNFQDNPDNNDAWSYDVCVCVCVCKTLHKSGITIINKTKDNRMKCFYM